MNRYAFIGLILTLAVIAVGCGNVETQDSTGKDAIENEVPVGTSLQTTEHNSGEPGVQVRSVRFLQAFDIGHPSQAGDGMDVFVLNSRDEQAAFLDGLDAVAAATNANYDDDTVIVITFTANCITYEEEYSLESVALDEGAGGSIEILYTFTPDRMYSDAECPYYAIIVVPKINIASEDIDVNIENR